MVIKHGKGISTKDCCSMRKFLLRLSIVSSIVLAMTTEVQGQLLSVNPDTSFISADMTLPQVKTYLYILNHTNDTMSLQWYRGAETRPSSWGIAVCDEWVCYDSTIPTAPMLILPMDSAVLAGQFGHANESGSAMLEVQVYDPGDSASTVITATFVANISASTGIKATGDPVFKFFPNPVDDMLMIESVFDQQEIAVYNMLGRQVAYIQNSKTIDLSRLKPGPYLVSVKPDGFLESFSHLIMVQ